ncbi:MAG: zinc ribbon domain-containing protein, partial [Candidatus Hermodarchaeota archaeon]
FYISVQPEGNDYELFFKREGKLVRTIHTIVSSSEEEEINFDGINDFGDYIDEGMYNYTINIIDYAGNIYSDYGWFYADYTAPKITEYFTDFNIAPIPRYDLTVTVNITENTNQSSTYLYYKKDGGSWQTVLMNPIGYGYHAGTIPGDSSTNHVQYYIKSIDAAGNEAILDNDGNYYTYGIPHFDWDSDGLFKESKSYSSSQDYEITVEINSNLEYVDEVIFRYSYDGGDEWEDLELEQNSPEFTGKLDDIPGDLRELQYKVIVVDIYGNEYQLTDTREVEFYPEVPSVTLSEGDIAIIIVVSAIVGLVVAIGYIKLKSTSHEMIYKQIFLKDYKKKVEKSEKSVKKEPTKNVLEKSRIDPDNSQIELLEEDKTATPFTKVYLSILCGTMALFVIALIISIFTPQVGMLLLSASLLMAVFGYMILMSRDISINIYLERIYLRNVALEIFQIFFMFINIVALLFVGNTIDWFRYYLIESTYDIGAASIPRLYISTFAVFFTSLVLVGITTYIQLRKTVKNLQKQRSQGASSNLLLYLKDQNSSRLITRLGYKTVVFLVTVLLAVITTTNLLTEDTGRALLIVIIPFVVASCVTLLIHRYYEIKSKERKKDEIQLPFSDSKKFCGKCGKEMYLSNKYCGSCGAQQVFEDMFGTYITRCTECNALINDKAKYCTECGKKT